MRRVALVIVVMLALALVAAPALAHNMEVKHPQTGEVINQKWVGGFTVPEPAQDAGPMFGPLSLPPSHSHGLVQACHGTAASPAVTLQAPPYFTGCVHGEP